MNKHNRCVRRGILLFVSLTLLWMTSESMLASSNASVYSKKTEVKSGESVTIPVRIKNNPGLMGYVFSLSYDKKVITIDQIRAGEISQNGIFDNNLSISQNGKFDILWSYTKDVTEDGVLFYLDISVKKGAKKKTSIGLKVSQEDTFNEDYEDVILQCSSLEVDVEKDSSVNNAKTDGGKKSEGNSVDDKPKEVNDVNNSEVMQKKEASQQDENEWKVEDIESLDEDVQSSIGENKKQNNQETRKTSEEMEDSESLEGKSIKVDEVVQKKSEKKTTIQEESKYDNYAWIVMGAVVLIGILLFSIWRKRK